MWAHAERFQPGQERTMSISRFLKDEAGTTAIEYAIIAAGISIVIVVAVQAIGTTLNATFTSVAAGFK
jgi:pilus assembly protein Flp/PilA